MKSFNNVGVGISFTIGTTNATWYYELPQLILLIIFIEAVIINNRLQHWIRTNQQTYSRANNVLARLGIHDNKHTFYPPVELELPSWPLCQPKSFRRPHSLTKHHVLPKKHSGSSN